MKRVSEKIFVSLVWMGSCLSSPLLASDCLQDTLKLVRSLKLEQNVVEFSRLTEKIGKEKDPTVESLLEEGIEKKHTELKVALKKPDLSKEVLKAMAAELASQVPVVPPKVPLEKQPTPVIPSVEAVSSKYPGTVAQLARTLRGHHLESETAVLPEKAKYDVVSLAHYEKPRASDSDWLKQATWGPNGLLSASAIYQRPNSAEKKQSLNIFKLKDNSLSLIKEIPLKGETMGLPVWMGNHLYALDEKGQLKFLEFSEGGEIKKELGFDLGHGFGFPDQYSMTVSPTGIVSIAQRTKLEFFQVDILGEKLLNEGYYERPAGFGNIEDSVSWLSGNRAVVTLTSYPSQLVVVEANPNEGKWSELDRLQQEAQYKNPAVVGRDGDFAVKGLSQGVYLYRADSNGKIHSVSKTESRVHNGELNWMGSSRLVATTGQGTGFVSYEIIPNEEMGEKQTLVDATNDVPRIVPGPSNILAYVNARQLRLIRMGADGTGSEVGRSDLEVFGRSFTWGPNGTFSLSGRRGRLEVFQLK